MQQLRTVLVGLGNMGRNHLRVMREHPGFRVTTVVDPRLDDLGRTALEGERWLRDVSQLGREDWDCAVIAVPTEYHYAVADLLLERRRPILIEKPLAATPHQGQRLLEKAAALGTPLGVGHVERFNPAIRKVQEIIEAEWIGRPIHFSIKRLGGYPAQVKAGDNVLLDLAVHDLDVLRMLLGPFSVKASACYSTRRPGIYDTAEMLMLHESGVSAALQVNWVTPTKIRTLRVTGTEGVCFADYILQTVVLWGGNLLRKDPDHIKIDYSSLIEQHRAGDRVEFGVVKEEPLKRQLDEFYRLCLGQPSQLCAAEDAQSALRLAHQAIEQAQTGIRGESGDGWEHAYGGGDRD